MSAWQIVQPGGFGASLEDELFAELDREEQQHRKKPLASDSDEDSEEEEEEEEGNKQPWTHLCVLDFEACREELESNEWLYEITELPVTLLNCTTLKVPPPFILYSSIHVHIHDIDLTHTDRWRKGFIGTAGPRGSRPQCCSVTSIASTGTWARPKYPLPPPALSRA